MINIFRFVELIKPIEQFIKKSKYYSSSLDSSENMDKTSGVAHNFEMYKAISNAIPVCEIIANIVVAR